MSLFLKVGYPNKNNAEELLNPYSLDSNIKTRTILLFHILNFGYLSVNNSLKVITVNIECKSYNWIIMKIIIFSSQKSFMILSWSNTAITFL